MKQYDVIVIGTGAGNIILDYALEKGLKAAQIEKGKFGGTCLNKGCIPTKVMVTAADMIRQARNAEEIGVDIGSAKINWDKLKNRVWKKIDGNQYIHDVYTNMRGLDVYKGEAYFTAPKTLKVRYTDGSRSEEIAADKIFIAAGAETNVPEIEGLEQTGYLTSEKLFGNMFPEKPFKELIILGGGPIGCEFAHFFSAADTKVKIVQRNVRLLPKEDYDISMELQKAMQDFGVEMHFGVNTVKVQYKDGKKIVTLSEKGTGKTYEISGDEILVAPGVRAATKALNLEVTDIKTDAKGNIITNEFLETTEENVWAIGDVNGNRNFRHVANHEADVVSHNLFFADGPADYRWVDYDLTPAVTYTYPQVAHVGLNKEEAERRGYDVAVGMHYFYETAKGYALGFSPRSSLKPFIKVIAEKKTGKLLGAHIIGPEASVLIQPFINLMSAGENVIKPVNPEVGSELTKKLRAEKLTRYLDPHYASTIKETMIPHPSLQEATMWTQYYLKY